MADDGTKGDSNTRTARVEEGVSGLFLSSFEIYFSAPRSSMNNAIVEHYVKAMVNSPLET